MAGREGLEPSNARSKAWCLTSLATAQQTNASFPAVNPASKRNPVYQPAGLKHP
jgi:hypothetical protein